MTRKPDAAQVVDFALLPAFHHQIDAAFTARSERNDTGRDPEQWKDGEDERLEQVDPGKPALLNGSGCAGERCLERTRLDAGQLSQTRWIANRAAQIPYANPYVNVNLTTSSTVGLHPQLVELDVTSGDGANVVHVQVREGGCQSSIGPPSRLSGQGHRPLEEGRRGR